MNVLVIDDDIRTVDLVGILPSISKDYNILNTYGYEDGLKKYNNNKIDVVVADHSSYTDTKLLKKISEINPTQKTITLTKELSCGNKLNCDNCVENYNRSKLIKPVDPLDLHTTIKNFDEEECKFFANSKNIVNVISGLSKKYYGCVYDEEHNTISISDTLSHKYIFDIINVLNKHYIKYEINKGDTIQIQITCL